jgi:hypothetical protein
VNAPTIVIALVIAALFVLAVRRLVRRGTCSSCEQHGSCAVAASGARCPGRTAGGTGQAGPVALGMPGGLTHVPTSAGAPAGGIALASASVPTSAGATVSDDAPCCCAERKPARDRTAARDRTSSSI